MTAHSGIGSGDIVLEAFSSPFGHITIYQSTKDGTRTYYQDDCFHSRCDDRGHSTVAYVHAMSGIMLQTKTSAVRRRVLLLGCAGGSLATMLSHEGCDVVAVDINPQSFDLARQYFYLPQEVSCVVADAREFLARCDERFDAIALDVFDKGLIPPHLRTVECFTDMLRCLGDNGVIVANCIIEHDLDRSADRLAASLAKASGSRALLLDQFNQPDRNAVIIGGTIPDAVLPRGSEPKFIQDELRTMHLREVRKPVNVYFDEK